MPNRTRHQNEMATENYNAGHQVDNDPNVTKCCKPSGCDVDEVIHMDDLSDCVKVICNNEHCHEGRYMHRECFEQWEESVLTFLRSTGRARSWSEKQRLQNLWTKKGYDLAYKACGCKCSKGHLKKDLDWIAPSASQKEDQNKKRKNRRKKMNDKPTLIVSTSAVQSVKHHASTMNANHISYHASNSNNINNNSNTSSNIPNQNSSQSNGNVVPISRVRTCSMSSTGSGGSGGTSPPMSGSESQSPGLADPSISNLKKYLFGEQARRERHSSGSIFSRRLDYSSFSHLPRHKLNSYHIKMEDDVNHGNDDTRCFLLSTLSANRVNRTACILCHSTMIIFDRYPLIDGTFFLSPRQHSKSAVPCGSEDDRSQYLNAVCMACLEDWSASLRCKGCGTKWDGSHLILGSMYSYDIFAAVPCCVERLRCNNCNHLVISPERRLEYFSDYSHPIPCSHCGIVANHFVKPLQVTFSRTTNQYKLPLDAALLKK